MDALTPDLFSDILRAEDCQRFVDTHLGRAPAYFETCTFPDAGFTFTRFLKILRDTLWTGEDQLKFYPDRGGSATYVDPSAYLTKQGVLTLDEILRLKAARITIYALQLELRDQALRQLAQSVTRTGYFRTRVDGFFTPAKGRGSITHCDPHDLLILQVHGSKVWTVDDAPMLKNLTADVWTPATEPLTIKSPTQYHLKPGQALYIPSGVLHHVETMDHDSLHLVFGLNALTWHDVAADWLAKEMRVNPALRAPVLAEGTQAEAMETLTALATPDALNEAAQAMLSERALRQRKERFGQMFVRDLSQLG